MGKGTCAELLCKWLISILNERDDKDEILPPLTKYSAERGCSDQRKYYYCTDHTYVSIIEELLVPIAASTRFKSDVAILWNVVGAIVCEINSLPMEDTIAKLFANLINWLWYIRHFDPSVTSWVGFTFPKYKVKSNNNFACEVKVVWKECRFVCNVTFLRYQNRSAKDIYDTN